MEAKTTKMNKDILEGEIQRIAGLIEIEREPEIGDLWKKCKQGGYTQKIGLLRELVASVVNAPRDQETRDKADGMLADYFMLNIKGKGKVRIGHFTSEQVNGHGRRILHLLGLTDFNLWNAGKPEAEMWLNNPRKRKYTGLITNPSKPTEHDGKLNLWHGFGIGPAPGDAKPFLDYVNTILAQGQQVWADYILNWLAWTIQNPGERIGVALCLISDKEGTGKGSLGNLLLTIFGQHGRSVTSSENLLGHFNAQLADALFVFADEALFAGDLRGADKFKSLVTEPWMNITPKGVDSIEMENRLSILMATNHNWAATVGWSDRRFAMFEVSDHPQARKYWDELHGWLNGGGKSVVLDFLQRRDLSGFHPVDSRPFTPIYLEQRRQSLRDNKRWWANAVMHEDMMAGTRLALVVVLDDDNTTSKQAIYGAYENWHRETQHKAAVPVSDKVFWKDLYQMTGHKVEEYRATEKSEVPGEPAKRPRRVRFPMPDASSGASSDASTDWDMLREELEKWLSN